MRKLFWQMNVTLDGFMEGPNRELDDTTQVVDEDFDPYCTEMLKSIDAILLGRMTYQLFADYWPSATGPDADRLNELPKIVFSRMLEQVEWKNSRLVKENVAEEVARLKRQPGQDLALFGSADIASTFRQPALDEYRIKVSPVILGSGKPLFKDIKDRINLKLLKTKIFILGVVELLYQSNIGEFK